MAAVLIDLLVSSGPNDHVFVNFVDHGAPGLLAFPNEELHADQLQKAFDEMHAKRRFGKLVMYTEACEAGSMFKSHLPEDYNSKELVHCNIAGTDRI